jgi:hypothetical protein
MKRLDALQSAKWLESLHKQLCCNSGTGRRKVSSSACDNIGSSMPACGMQHMLSHFLLASTYLRAASSEPGHRGWQCLDPVLLFGKAQQMSRRSRLTSAALGPQFRHCKLVVYHSRQRPCPAEEQAPGCTVVRADLQTHLALARTSLGQGWSLHFMTWFMHGITECASPP